MKTKINGIIVVEGKTDVAFLSEFIDAEFVITNGSEISEKTIEYLKNCREKRDIFVLTDPDSPGKRIRDVLDAEISNLKHCFVAKEKSIKHNKVGVAESTKEEVLNALKNYIVSVKEPIGNIIMSDLVKLGLSGAPDSDLKREKVCEKFHLGFCNAKTFLKRVNNCGITLEEIEKKLMNESQYFENVKSYKLLANKSLGQNFLINPEVAKSIVNFLEISDDDEVIEIGSGLGSLSYFLAKFPAKTQLIDIDERMLQFLNDQFGNCKNVVVRRQNILKEDLTNYSKIIGNLPYYITSSIVEHILLTAINAKKIVLMTQKEVYPKLLSNFKSPLSLFLNYVADISAAKEVGRNNFAPIPHVDSVVFVLTPNENIKNEENRKLLKLMQQLFLLRRKNILNNLTNVVKNKEKAREILSKLNVDTNKRPEELDINFYISLLKELNF